MGHFTPCLTPGREVWGWFSPALLLSTICEGSGRVPSVPRGGYAYPPLKKHCNEAVCTLHTAVHRRAIVDELMVDRWNADIVYIK